MSKPEPIDALLALVVPPQELVGVASEILWSDAERLAGISYPRDFKEVNRHYGLGWFIDFVWILSPLGPRTGYNLLTYSFDTEIISEAIRNLHSAVLIDRLLPVAWTRNGDEFFYIVEPDQTIKRIALVASRAAGVEIYAMPLAELIAGLIEGTIQTSIFPPEFSARPKIFRPSNES